MGANPAAPINLMEKPIHDHEQHDHGKQSRRGLKIERRHVVTKRANDLHRDTPRDQGCYKREART